MTFPCCSLDKTFLFTRPHSRDLKKQDTSLVIDTSMCQAQVPPAGIDTSRGEEKKPEIPVMCETPDISSHNPAVVVFPDKLESGTELWPIER